MKTTIVRYKTHPEHAEENAALVRAVYAELRETKPSGFHYATFRMADGVTFVHFAVRDGEENPLLAVPAFKEFQRNLKERCAEPPVVSDLTRVGSYDWLGGDS